MLDTSLEAWQRVQDVNLRSVFLCCKHGIPHLLEGGGGSVINTASFVAVMGAAVSQISYTASKGGVLALSRELGVEFARRGVRVNALCPGPVATPLLMELFAKDEEQAARRMVHVPMGRFAEPREIANAALFLASDESSYVTASTFMVDGGLVRRLHHAGVERGAPDRRAAASIQVVSPRAIARFTAIGRVAIGAAILAAPGRFMRSWIGDDASSTGAAVLSRAVGTRDLAIGAGTLASLGAPEDLERWLRAALAADATDLAVTVAHGGSLPPRGRNLVIAITVPAVGLGIAALAGLARRSRPAEEL